jgi:hypothetical protein
MIEPATDSAAPSGALLLRWCGECLYGEHWVSPLARALGVNLRTMQRWVAGQNEPRESLWREIDELLLRRQSDLAAVRRE